MAPTPRAVSTCAMADDEDQGGTPVRQIVAAVILLVALVGVGLWLTSALRGAATIQDCVAAGRTNCAPVR